VSFHDAVNLWLAKMLVDLVPYAVIIAICFVVGIVVTIADRRRRK